MNFRAIGILGKFWTFQLKTWHCSTWAFLMNHSTCLSMIVMSKLGTKIDCRAKIKFISYVGGW